MRRACWLLGLAMVGCEDPAHGLASEQEHDPWSRHDVEVDVLVGTYVEIRHQPHLPACQGDIERLDRHVEQVAELLELELPDERFIYYVFDTLLIDEACGPKRAGCAAGPRHAYGRTVEIGMHELNHLMTRGFSGSTPLWREGLARALEPKPTALGSGHPDAMLELRALDLNYGHAGHFVRAIWLERGFDTVAAIASASRRNDLEEARRVFADHMGIDLLEYGDRFLRQTPKLYGSMLPPDEPPLPWTGDRVLATVDLDCDDAHTESSQHGGLHREAYVVVPDTDHYELDADEGYVQLQSLGRPGEPAPRIGTVQHGLPWAGELEQGLYTLGVTVDGFEPRTVVVELRPKIGPLPTGGD